MAQFGFWQRGLPVLLAAFMVAAELKKQPLPDRKAAWFPNPEQEFVARESQRFHSRPHHPYSQRCRG
jgi:hypothetical protein